MPPAPTFLGLNPPTMKARFSPPRQIRFRLKSCNLSQCLLGYPAETLLLQPVPSEPSVKYRYFTKVSSAVLLPKGSSSTGRSEIMGAALAFAFALRFFLARPCPSL